MRHSSSSWYEGGHDCMMGGARFVSVDVLRKFKQILLSAGVTRKK